MVGWMFECVVGLFGNIKGFGGIKNVKGVVCVLEVLGFYLFKESGGS